MNEIQEIFNNVLACVITILPSITAIISFVVSAILTIKKVKNANKDSVDQVVMIYQEITRNNKTLLEETEAVRKALNDVILENKELKKRLESIDPAKVRGE